MKLLALLTFGICWALNVRPWLRGEISQWKHQTGVDSRLSTQKFPDELLEFENYLAHIKPDIRVLYLPRGFNGVVQYIDDPIYAYGVRDIFSFYSPVPGFFSRFDRSLGASDFSALVAASLASSDFLPLLRLTNTQFIIVRKNMMMENREALAETLRREIRKGSMQLIRESAALSVYALQRFRPHFYAATSASYVDGDINALPILAYTDYLGETFPQSRRASGHNKVLLISEQVQQTSGKGNFQSSLASFILNGNNAPDLAVQFGQSARLPLSQLNVRSVDISETGVYEFYLHVPRNAVGDIPAFAVGAEPNQVVALSPITGMTYQNAMGKHVRVGELSLKTGRYVFEKRGTGADLGQGLALVLINKSVRGRLQEEFRRNLEASQTDLCYLFGAEKAGEFWIGAGAAEAKAYDFKIKLRGRASWPNASPSNVPLVKVDKVLLALNDFGPIEGPQGSGEMIFTKRVLLGKGRHEYEKFNNPFFGVEWMLLEPAEGDSRPGAPEEPEIIFQKVNPTRYRVKVVGAKNPFWLVFSESFHEYWKIYPSMPNDWAPDFQETVAEYPQLKVTEGRHEVSLTPRDVRFLWKEPLNSEHQIVNGHANGWYIDPKGSRLGEDFILDVYFVPQSLFYLGFGISGIILISCLGYLVWSARKRNYPQ